HAQARVEFPDRAFFVRAQRPNVQLTPIRQGHVTFELAGILGRCRHRGPAILLTPEAVPRARSAIGYRSIRLRVLLLTVLSRRLRLGDDGDGAPEAGHA